jgi:ElaB/YqjD/DUF883 family membrane-anchored ribosome-binding protein
MRRRNDKNSEENLAALLSTIDKGAVAPDREILKQLRERSAQEFTTHTSNLSANPSKSTRVAAMRNMIMTNPWTKLAVAAAVLIVCAVGLSLWRGTGSSIVLADVLARIEQVKAFRSKGISKSTSETSAGKPSLWEMRSGILESKEYGIRLTHQELDPNGATTGLTETYFNVAKKIVTTVDHAAKRYIHAELDDFMAQQIQKEFSRYSDPAGFLREIVAGKYESMGRSTVDGDDVEGFRATDPNYSRQGPPGLTDAQTDRKVWIDVKTRLPVRYESLTNGRDPRGAKTSFHYTMYDFQWDIPIDVSEFEPPGVPDGYGALVEKTAGVVNEQVATESLRQCAELLGKYPENLHAAPSMILQFELEKSDSPAATQLKEELNGLAELERANRLADASMPLRRATRFYLFDLAGKDPAYYGSTVTAEDADKVLLRWKLSDSEYRVLFGDLHAETVSRERLAELEKDLPK